MDEDIWDLIRGFRKAVNMKVYNGRAPNDSNALTEAWPTATGAGFTFERHGRKLAVVIAPADDVKDLLRPDWPQPAAVDPLP